MPIPNTALAVLLINRIYQRIYDRLRSGSDRELYLECYLTDHNYIIRLIRLYGGHFRCYEWFVRHLGELLEDCADARFHEEYDKVWDMFVDHAQEIECID